MEESTFHQAAFQQRRINRQAPAAGDTTNNKAEGFGQQQQQPQAIETKTVDCGVATMQMESEMVTITTTSTATVPRDVNSVPSASM